MVNSNSPTFKFSEKIGLIFVKGIRYMIMGGVVVFINGRLVGSQPFQPVPNLPPPPAP